MKLRSTAALSVALVAALATGGGIAYAATSASASAPKATTVYACVVSGDIASAVSTSPRKCAKGTEIEIGAKGPAGPKGPKGAKGAKGATGAKGPKGATGAKGAGAATAGSTGLDERVVTTAGTSGTVVTATCPLSSHPYALGGGYSNSATIAEPALIDAPESSGTDEPATGWTVEVETGTVASTITVYAICSE